MSRYSEESKQIIEDICYFESLISTDKQIIKQRMLTRVSNVNTLDDKAAVMCEEVSEVLANMSARLGVMETLLSADKNLSSAAKKIDTLSEYSATEVGSVLLDSVKLSIVDIGYRNGLWGLMHTLNNAPYHKLASGSEVNFVLPINRSVKQTLAVDVIEAAPQRLLNDSCFYIDGHKLKHRVKTINGVTRLICYLPKSKTGNTTYVSLKLPVTNEQDFKFYLSDVNCVPKLTLSAFAKNKITK
ncbi:hypothetical protein [Shewanella halifaxensis]|uniref:hypothetical protein n=1 Tax=Shewanella halifaxensis TaxID=271098 RepID=UPI000D58FA80|nr:hypothetical protein [Shewanella halifaxensis]